MLILISLLPSCKINRLFKNFIQYGVRNNDNRLILNCYNCFVYLKIYKVRKKRIRLYYFQLFRLALIS